MADRRPPRPTLASLAGLCESLAVTGANYIVRPTPPRHELVAHDYRELARASGEIAQRLENGELLKFEAEEA